jgi:mannonate dehydratase
MKMTNRRDFGKLALGGTLGGLLAARATVHPSAPGIKLCAQMGPTPTDEQLLFLKQIGAEYVSVTSTPDLRTAEGFLQIKKRYADAGITVWNIGNMSVHNMPEVTLNLPGRDQKVEEYKQYLRNLGQGGHLLHDLRPHGQRHLEQRTRHHPRRNRPGIRHGQPR